MNLSDITTKAWILALFKRDDGERFLLGDGWYDFKDSLQHFSPNNIASDIVELQGADGQLLAGQVRRSSAQSFDGFIGDATISKADIESRRVDFLGFFQVRHKYTVIYIFPDGTAIQRQRGYLTDAPSVPEMWQKFPEYHVALNFEDVNYYEYAENAQGEEIYAHSENLTALSYTTLGGALVINATDVSTAYPGMALYQLVGNTVQDGTPSPTNPAIIKNATGLQTISFTGSEQGQLKTFELNLGKNLFDVSSISGSGLTVSGKTISGTATAFNTNFGSATSGLPYYRIEGPITVTAKAYTDGNASTSTNVGLLIRAFYTDGSFGNLVSWTNNETTASTKTGTTADGKAIQKIVISYNNTATNIWHLSDIRIESGTVRTAYADFFTPIELFHLEAGNLSDYIVPQGSSWSLHKEIGKIVFDGSESGWNVTNYSGRISFWVRNSDVPNAPTSGKSPKLCNRFVYTSTGYTSAPIPSLAENTQDNTPLFIFVTDGSYGTTVDAWKAWLASNPVFVYYKLATPTNTSITNATLVATLDNLKSQNLYAPETTLTATAFATASNEAVYHRVRYLSNSNEATFDIQATGNASPLWIVGGPASNPTIKNVTTGQELKYNSTLTAGQTLRIDMANQTAMIGNTNVISYVSGDWIELVPGENTIAFTTGNQTGTSKIYWNGVVG